MKWMIQRICFFSLRIHDWRADTGVDGPLPELFALYAAFGSRTFCCIKSRRETSRTPELNRILLTLFRDHSC